MNTLIVVSTDCGLHLVRMTVPRRVSDLLRNKYISDRLQVHFLANGDQTVDYWAEFANLNTISIG